jgi:hypothetical protein
MISPISSLANMEWALYGGYGMNSSAPSYLNGYAGTSNYLNQAYYPSFYGANNYYNNYSDTSAYQYATNFGQNIPQYYTSQAQNQAQATEQSTIFQGLKTSEAEALVKTYAKGLEYNPKLLSAVGSGAAFGALMMNPRILAHPINFTTTTFSKNSVVNNLFKDVKKAGSALNVAWKENNLIMEELYAQVHRAESRSKWKLGAIRKQYTQSEFDQLIKLAEDALKPGADGKIDIKKAAKITEQLREVNSMSNGWLRHPIDNFNNKAETVTSKLAEIVDKKSKSGSSVRNNAARLLKYRNSKNTFRTAFQRSGGKLGLAFGLISLLMSAEKIKSAFNKDKKTGWKQLGQSTTKAVAETAGWALGETAAVWAGAKWGATIGTAFGPGVGTAIGAVIGMIGGSIGCWAFGKIAKRLVGDDVANDIDAEKLAQTNEGQQQILQDVLQRAEKGEKMDAMTQQAIRRLGSLYAA